MAGQNLNSFQSQSTLSVNGKIYHFHQLGAVEKAGLGKLSRLPYSHKILLENLLRCEDGVAVKKDDIEALMNWDAKATPSIEIQYMPARVLLQDFTGVPAVADLAAMRAALKRLGKNPSKINPLQPADLVIDHSVQVDYFGTDQAFEQNMKIEFDRNNERYLFLKWGQKAFENFRVVPPSTGIVHQVNLEYLASVAITRNIQSKDWVYPDTLIGTDSHTTMINGLGVMGWGVGGIEAEAALLGQPVTMLIPQVVGFKLTGKLPTGATATDLVLTIVEILRKKGVVGKFVEYFGPGISNLSLADRATIGNMAPEYGATLGLFPVDEVTTGYLKLTGRADAVPLVEAYYKEQGLWYTPDREVPDYSDILELDLGMVEPSLAGPSRPQDRVPLKNAKTAFADVIQKSTAVKDPKSTIAVDDPDGQHYELTHGAVVIAAITSCTNTSNPSVLVAAGLLAKKAVEKGLMVKPWVKTSLAPGSKVVTDYLTESGLMPSLEALKFNLVGYGCTTCIGNSGPLPEHVAAAITKGELNVTSVLSGNRNFEGRISNLVRSNYLASPPLVVAYAIAGSMAIDLNNEPLGQGKDGPVFLKDIWPSSDEIEAIVAKHVNEKQFRSSYGNVFDGTQEWQALNAPSGELYEWERKSTYIKEPPFFEGISLDIPDVKDIRKARVLALLGDSVTTDHISPAGSFAVATPAGKYLTSQGVEPVDFNSYGSRRGNHEVMMRGTFANVRIKNKLVPGVEGGFTRTFPGGEQTTIFEASVHYKNEGTPTIIIAGKEYGTGSSRDWAAKGPKLLGVQAVIAESFERIHRSNLVGMGILPLEFKSGQSATHYGLTGEEEIDILALSQLKPGCEVKIIAHGKDGSSQEFAVNCRIDTPNELEYYKNGGILSYVLRQLAHS